MFGNLSGWHFLILLFIILLLFGAPKLPGLAKSVGQSMKIFKKEVRDLQDDDAPRDPQAPHGQYPQSPQGQYPQGDESFTQPPAANDQPNQPSPQAHGPVDPPASRNP